MIRPIAMRTPYFRTMELGADVMQILQKEIAHVRGLSIKQLRSPTGLRPLGDVRGEDHALDIESSTGVGGKRKYRRHPKVSLSQPYGSNVDRIWTIDVQGSMLTC